MEHWFPRVGMVFMPTNLCLIFSRVVGTNTVPTLPNCACTLSARTESAIESTGMKMLNIVTKAIFLLCLLVGLVQTLAAAENLFYAEVEIADESAEARQASIASALHKVLIKLTGDSKIKSHKGVSGLLKNSPDYVSQYRYRVEEVSGDAQQEDGTQQLVKYIQIQFDKTAVDRSLRALGITTWESSRPELLLWLTYEQQGKPRLLDTEALPQAIPLLQQAAGDRGLLLQLPMMDLQDQASLSGADVWSGNEQAIKQASGRYPHDVILTARITGNEGGKWNGSWILYNRDEPREFTRSGDDLAHVLRRGMDRAADLLAEIYAPAVTGETSDPVSVRILQVDTAGDYARVMDLFRQLGGVSRVTVKSMQNDVLLLEVRIRGGIQAINNSLQLGGELIPASGAQNADEVQPPGLTFRMNY